MSVLGLLGQNTTTGGLTHTPLLSVLEAGSLSQGVGRDPLPRIQEAPSQLLEPLGTWCPISATVLVWKGFPESRHLYPLFIRTPIMVLGPTLIQDDLI